MDAGQSLLVIIAIKFDVFDVLRSKFTHHIIDIFHAFVAFTHCQCREVSVAAGTIPFLEELGGKRDRDIEIFSDSLEQVSRDPELVTNGDSFYWSDLIFPLARHNLRISSGNLNSSVKACLVVSIGYYSTKAIIRSHRAIVWTLGTRIAIVRPT